MITLSKGLWLTRDNRIARVTGLGDGIWPYKGTIAGSSVMYTWTKRGGYSSKYTDDNLNKVFADPADLVKKITRETHPEEYL